MNTADQVKAYADVMELAGVDFLDAQGGYVKDPDKADRVRLKFIDGAEFNLTSAELDKLGAYSFRFRPAWNHS